MNEKPKYTAFTIVYFAQMETALQQMRDTLAGGPLWGDDISAAYFAVSPALRKINAELQRMRGTLSRGPLWDDINAAYLAVSSALHQIDAELYSTLSRRQLWDDINAAYLAVSSALGKIEADIKAMEDKLVEADIKTRE